VWPIPPSDPFERELVRFDQAKIVKEQAKQRAVERYDWGIDNPRTMPKSQVWDKASPQKTPPPFNLKRDYLTYTSEPEPEKTNKADNQQSHSMREDASEDADFFLNVTPFDGKIDQVVEKLTDKVDQVKEQFSEVVDEKADKIDQVVEKLTGKVDQVKENLADVVDEKADKIDQVVEKLTDKIDQVKDNL
jgi:uncharacterized phage infection (PIP) family protein YhgE